jgi:hypothetical protein
MCAMAGKKRRCIVIMHDDFDLPGANGVKEAKEFASNLIAGKDQMIADALAAAEQDPDKAAQIREHAEKFKFFIRNIPEELL